MIAVREGAVVFVNVGDNIVEQVLSEAGALLKIPVAVFGKDHDERDGLP